MQTAVSQGQTAISLTQKDAADWQEGSAAAEKADDFSVPGSSHSDSGAVNAMTHWVTLFTATQPKPAPEAFLAKAPSTSVNGPNLMKLHLHIPLCGAMILFTGCVVVPLPHLSRKSPPVDGRAVDATTGRPIKGAVIELTMRQGGARTHAWSRDLSAGPTVETSADGAFHFNGRYNFHLLWYANPSFQFKVPYGEYWTGGIRATQEGYQPLLVPRTDDWRGGTTVNVGDLKLVPDRQTSSPITTR